MADTNILQLPIAIGIDGTEYAPIVQSGTTKRVQTSLLGTGLAGSAQSANTIFAGPSSGSPSGPTFRALVNADLPSMPNVTIKGNVSGSAATPSDLTGTEAASILSFTQSGTGAVSTLMVGQAKQVFTPQQFGAVGDGSTDDTAAFNRLFVAAKGKDVVIPPAIYSVGALTTLRDINNNVPSSVIAYGATLKSRSSISGAVLTLCNVHKSTTPTIYGFNLEGLTIDGNNLASIGIYVTGCFSMRWRSVEVKNATSDGFRFVGDYGTSVFTPAPGGVYYCDFDSLYAHDNGASGISLKSIDNISEYYVAANTFTNVESSSNGTYGINIDWANCNFDGGALENNGSGGVNMDNTLANGFKEMYQEGNGGAAPAGYCYIGTANTHGLSVLGGRTVGNTAEFTASLLTSGFSDIDTGDYAGDRIIYKGKARFTQAGIQLPTGTGFAMGGATAIADSIAGGSSGIAFLRSGATKAQIVNGLTLGTGASDSGVGTLAAQSTIQSGVAGTTGGGILVAGVTSGVISIRPQSAAGTYNFNLPTTAGVSGQLFVSGGGSSSPNTWTSTPVLGLAGSTVGTLGFQNATSGTLTLSPPTGALGTVTLTLPAATDTLVARSTTDTLSNKTLVSPTLGTPASGTLTNCTGLPISTGVSGLGTGVATFLATPSSANLLSALTDKTGTGVTVFGTSPTLTTNVVVSGSASAAPTAVGTNYVQIVGLTGNFTATVADAIAAQSQVVMRRGNGTNASPTNMLAGQNIGAHGWGGYDGSAWTTTNHAAQVLAQSFNDWSGSDHSSRLTFSTTPSGSTTLTEVMRINASGGLGVGTTTDPGALGAVLAANFIKSSSASGGIGYAAGAGGTVTQATSKATAFTLSKTTGQITFATGALAAGATSASTWTNTSIAAGDSISFSHVSGGTLGAYVFNAACGSGTVTLNITNVSTGSLNEQPVVQFNIIKGATS